MDMRMKRLIALFIGIPILLIVTTIIIFVQINPSVIGPKKDKDGFLLHRTGIKIDGYYVYGYTDETKDRIIMFCERVIPYSILYEHDGDVVLNDDSWYIGNCLYPYYIFVENEPYTLHKALEDGFISYESLSTTTFDIKTSEAIIYKISSTSSIAQIIPGRPNKELDSEQIAYIEEMLGRLIFVTKDDSFLQNYRFTLVVTNEDGEMTHFKFYENGVKNTQTGYCNDYIDKYDISRILSNLESE